MRWLRRGLYFFVGLTAIILILGVILVSIDLGRFKGQAESQLSDILGRELRIDGELHISIGKNLELYGENIFLANPSWAENETFVSVNKIHVIVDTRSLRSDRISITHLEIDGLRVNIEINARGETSWNFPALNTAPSQEVSNKKGSTLLPVVAGAITINDSLVSYKSPAQEEPYVLITDTLLSSLDTQVISLEHHGTFNDTELYFKQAVGPVENLLLMQDLNLEFNGNFGEITLTGTSWIDNLNALKRPLLDIRLEGPDATYLTELLSLQALTTGPMNLTASITENGELLASSIQGVFGEFTVNIDGEFQSLQDFKGFELNIDASGPNIASVTALAGLNGLPIQEFEVSASIEDDDTGYRIQNFELLVDDEVLSIDGHIGHDLLAGESEVEFDVQGSDIGASVIVLGNSLEQLPADAFSFSGRVNVAGNRITLTDIEAALGDNNEYQLQVSGFVNTEQNFIDSEISIHAQGHSLARLAELAGQEGIPDFPFEINADLHRGNATTRVETGLIKYGSLTLEISGEVGDRLLEDDLTLNLSTSIPNLKNLLDEFGIAIDMLPEGELSASGSLQQSAGIMSVEEFTLEIFDASIVVNGDVGLTPTLTGTQLQLELEGSDLSALLPEITNRGTLAHPFAASGTLFVTEEKLRLEKLKVNIAHTTFGGDLSLQRTPLFSSGSFNLIADSPNILHLVSEIEGFSEFSEEALKFSGSGHWEENFWSFEETRLDLDEGFFEINGSLDGFPSFERTNLDIEWFAPDVSKLSALVGQKLPTLPLRLKAHLDGTREVMSMNDFDLSLGSSDLSGDIILTTGDIPTVELTLRSQLIELTELRQATGEEEAVAKASDDKTSDDKRVIPDIELEQPLKILQTFNAGIDIEIGEIRGVHMTFFDMDLDANIMKGGLNVQNFALSDESNGHYNFSGNVIPYAENGIDYNLRAEGSQLSMTFRANSEEDLAALPQFDLEADLNGRGENIREIIGSSDGYVRAISGPGLLPSGALAMFSNDLLSELISTVNPFTKDDGYAQVTCSTIVLNFEDGIVQGSPSFVHETDKILILANSSINLNTEALNADFKVVPKKGLGLSFSSLLNPYVKVIGTMGEPSIVINPEGVLIQGGVAVATGGLSILALSFKDRFLSAPDPCGTAYQNSVEMDQLNGE